MVYLHGGGLVMGGGVSYFFRPKLLMEKKMVVVTLQYRVGALGNWLFIVRRITSSRAEYISNNEWGIS